MHVRIDKASVDPFSRCIERFFRRTEIFGCDGSNLAVFDINIRFETFRGCHTRSVFNRQIPHFFLLRNYSDVVCDCRKENLGT